MQMQEKRQTRGGSADQLGWGNKQLFLGQTAVIGSNSRVQEQTAVRW